MSFAVNGNGKDDGGGGDDANGTSGDSNISVSDSCRTMVIDLGIWKFILILPLGS